MSSVTRRALLGSVAALVLSSTMTPAVLAQGFPERDITWVVPAGPGGGSDTLARTIVNIIQQNDLLSVPILVENRPGGGGSIGATFVSSKGGDPYYIASVAEGFFISPLLGQSPVNYTDFTPVAAVASDLFVMVSTKDSGIRTLEDLKTLDAVRVGSTGAVSGSRILGSLVEQELGVTVRNVPFGSDGEVLAALLGGHIDIQFGNPAEILGQVQSGDLVPIAVSSAERSALLPDTPTFIEAGIDVEFTMPRGIIMPKDVPAEAVQVWEDVLRQVTETEQWKNEYITRNGMTPLFVGHEEFGELMVELDESYTEQLRAIGAIQ